MAEKHTPGPWFNDRDGREIERIDALRLRAFETNSDADRQAYFDAVSKWFQDRHYRDATAADAAANMLAALEACEPFVAHFKGGWSTHTPGNISSSELLDTIRAAIAKAEGRS